MLKVSVVLAAAMFVTSCSKTPSGGSGGSVSEFIDAQFIDDPVKGLEFVAASGNNGKTGNQGKFKCKKGEKVGFEIAGLDLGEAVCGERIFVDDLVSDDPEHSPEQVAAIIQSFAIPGSVGLDLTKALEVMQPNALASISFDKDDDTVVANALAQPLTDVKALLPPEVAATLPVAPKDPGVMREILDTAIAAYSNLTDLMKAALGLVAHDPSLSESEVSAATKMMTLTGKLVSTDTDDDCYDFVQARVSVSQEAADKPFKFIVHKVASFDALDAYDNTTYLCKDAEWCDQSPVMPLPKIISSPSINFFSSTPDQVGDDGSVWSSESVATLTASLSNGAFKVTGSFQDEVQYTYQDESGTFSCKYSVTSDAVTIPDEGPMSEEDDSYPHIDLPAGATGSYSLIDPSSIYCSDGTQALLTGGALPTSFNAVISGQSVVVSNTSTVAETWIKAGSWFDSWESGGQHAVYFDDTNKWHLDLTYNPDSPNQVGIYIYHIPSGNYDHKFCSFQLDRVVD
jgi:hypothetical protein